MEQFLQQRTQAQVVQQLPRVEIMQIPDSDSNSDASASETTSESESEETEEANNEVQRREDGWIDFTTARGLQEALRLIREDQARGPDTNINMLSTDINGRGNLDDMYFDPETGD